MNKMEYAFELQYFLLALKAFYLYLNIDSS